MCGAALKNKRKTDAKKTLSVFLAALLLVSVLCVGIQADGGTMRLSVSSASGVRGDEVTVSVSITSNPGIAVLNFDISYDTNVLELPNGSKSGTCTGLSGASFETGRFADYAWVDAANSTYTGTILTLTFKIKDTAALGASTISLGSRTLAGNYDEEPVTCSVSTGTITVNVAPHDHTWDSGTTTAATCTTAGKTVYKCTVEGCTETKTEEIAALGHDWDEGTVTKEATKNETGEKVSACKNEGCGETKTEVIPVVEKSGNLIWLWILLGLVVIGFILWLLLFKRKKDDDDDNSTGGAAAGSKPTGGVGRKK